MIEAQGNTMVYTHAMVSTMLVHDRRMKVYLSIINIHFGLGCSGFFKRSIHRSRRYTCKAQGESKLIWLQISNNK